MPQRNSGCPWESCYLRCARGVVNCETLECGVHGTNHEFTRIDTNKGTVCSNNEFTDTQPIEVLIRHRVVCLVNLCPFVSIRGSMQRK